MIKDLHGMDYSDVVIGSGPCGYSAAKSIIAGGRHPLIIDFGETPEFESSRIEKTSSFAMKDDARRTTVFDYPRTLIASCDGDHLPLSSARGGLSNIWGAGILLRKGSEIPKLASVWSGIEVGYQRLLEAIPHVGAVDKTSNRFPWPEDTSRAPQSDRFRTTVEHLQKSDDGVLFGWPRVALDNLGNSCIRCGGCLHGCPINLFFSSRIMLEKLASEGLCTFLTGPVLSIGRKSKKVWIQTPKHEILSDRVFIAAGPIATPTLLQKSQLAPRDMTVRDSAVFYAGFLNTSVASGSEADYTSSHLVAYSERAGEDDFQLAIYESNPEYVARLAAMVPRLKPIIKVPSILISRINVGIGFLDSSISGSLRLRYSNGRTWVSRNNSPLVRSKAESVLRRVASSTKQHGLHAVPKFILIPPTGNGYHSGASMPMGEDLIEMNGSLKTTEGVYVVDASVLPEIWAGSHTFTAMANAYRIVQEAI